MQKKDSGAWFRSQLCHWYFVILVSQPLLILCPSLPHVCQKPPIRIVQKCLERPQRQARTYISTINCYIRGHSFNFESWEEKEKQDLVTLSGSPYYSPSDIENITKLTLLQTLSSAANEQLQQTVQDCPSKINLSSSRCQQVDACPAK